MRMYADRTNGPLSRAKFEAVHEKVPAARRRAGNSIASAGSFISKAS